MVRGARSVIAAIVSVLVLLPGAAAASGEVPSGPTRPAASDPYDGAVQPSAVRDVRLQVPSGLAVGAPVTSMQQLGSIPVTVAVPRLNNGQVVVARNLWNGKGLRLPAFSRSSTPPLAVVRITHTSASGDPFAPRSADFNFGIYFKKDATSTGTSVDNGDNLLQRGLASDPAQFKLEVDVGRPSCTIKGDRGRVIVTSTVTVSSDRWYHATCRRLGNTVRLAVKEYRPDGSTRTVTTSRSGTIGSLAWSKRETPISVGGKLAANGAIVRSSTDQFNGLATHPSLEISG